MQRWTAGEENSLEDLMDERAVDIIQYFCLKRS